MRQHLFLLSVGLGAFCSCTISQEDSVCAEHTTQNHSTYVEILDSAQTLHLRYNPLPGFERVEVDSNSFGFFLRNLPLHQIDHKVLYFDGSTKSNPVYSSVVNLPIGNRDLHQCADAVMRLRADYLRSINHQEDIQFHFTNGFLCDYSNWLNGRSVIVTGNKVYWSAEGSKRQDSEENYWKYMEKVFTYAGTLSLSKELKSKAIEELMIGDVFIRGGSPGHAVIVVDLIVNPKTNEKRFLLAQSYMPAQEIHVLSDPNSPTGSSWFAIPEGDYFQTPEWTFRTNELKSF